uniref:Uncharacterized protein n=1 Tax=Globisporangium ultimum (strain ATCC 200006 / CBS 805.95 / DAOM BR144) TaxID=431595 RepID=K3WIW3_GLOUD
MWTSQMAFIYIYPAYAFTFYKFSGWRQATFTLVLPAMKIAAKNGMRYLVRGQEDVRPEFIILNVKVFHALFVANCLQGSTSLTTTMVLMTRDFLHACVSLRDVNAIMNTIRGSLDNDGRNSYGKWRS